MKATILALQHEMKDRESSLLARYTNQSTAMTGNIRQINNKQKNY